MLKKLILKNSEILIPVNLLTLGDLVRWIQDELLLKEVLIVGLVLDGKDLINELYRRSIKDIVLNERSHVQINVETPKNLKHQGWEVASDLAYSIWSRIKKLDLHFQREVHSIVKIELESIQSDLCLLMELMFHLKELEEEWVSYLEKIYSINEDLLLLSKRYQVLLENEEVEEMASVLRKNLQPLLKDLTVEGENLQLKWILRTEPSSPICITSREAERSST